MENNFFALAKDHALKHPHEEVCGLVIKTAGDELKYFPCRNISKNKNKSFQLDPTCYIASKRNGTIEGCFHSHFKGGSFSALDIRNSFYNNIKYYLYCVKKDKFYIFDPKQHENYKKYIDRSYINGTSDCETIIVDFYKNELGIEIIVKSPNRKGLSYEDLVKSKEHFWSLEKYKEEFLQNKFTIFYPKSLEDLKPYDIIVMSGIDRGSPIHGAMFLQHDLMLHQRFNFISTIESLREGYFRFIKYALRHETIK